MAANRHLNGRIKLIIGLLIVVVLLLVTDFVILRVQDNNAPARPQQTNSSSSRPLKTPAANVLKAGGQIVPAQWRSKARSLGYYCPSWNTSGGELSISSICLPLDN
ncbi:MAG TPA: hypothetical protein VFN51_01860 [Candidatus Saccharimonadales bacterium]|nr:hypothetical protein [Candidatus Saccharimonadales bacterium]